MTASSDLVTQRAPDLNDHPHTDRGDGERERFWGGVASVATVSALMSFATTLGVVDGRGPGDMWHRLLMVFLGLAVVAGLVAVAAALNLVRSERVRPRQLPRLLIAFWCERVSGWKMFLLGSLLMLPAFALYTPRLVGDSDSARIVASILYVQRGGRDYLVETQEVLLQHIALGPVLALGGIPALQALNAFFVVLLGGVVAVIAWWLTRSPLGALAAARRSARSRRSSRARTSCPCIRSCSRSASWASTSRTGDPCGSAGFEVALRGARRPVSRALPRGASGGPALPRADCLSLGHRPTRLDGPRARLRLRRRCPPLCPSSRDQRRGWGLGGLLANRVDFWLTKGYLEPIQVAMFGRPVNDSHGEYLAKISDTWSGSGARRVSS